MKHIFVTPFLDEIERVQNSVTRREFYSPSIEKGLTKQKDLHQLIKEGKDIYTTHALFKNANSETRSLLRDSGYTLILDEVMNVIEQVPLKRNDLELLITAGVIEIVNREGGIQYIKWNEDKINLDTKYNDIKKLALSNNLMFCNNTALIWNFPCDIFSLFKNVYILTYLFKGQYQRYYYDLHESVS